MKQDIRLYFILIVPIALLWLVLLFTDSRLGTDFYPLYFAGERIRMGLSPYGMNATSQLSQAWHAPFAAAGIAYPLPLLVLIIPFSFFPIDFATGAWIVIGITGVLAALRMHERWYILLAVALLFLPFYRSVLMGQATLIWFGLAACLIVAMQARRPELVGVICAIIFLKPQNGLLFGLAGLIWGWYGNRRVLWWFFGISVSLWGFAFLLQPGWFQAWLEQLASYQSIVRPPSLLPWGLLVLVAMWRLPWWARVAAAQVVVFPLSDLYSGLPLLFCWFAIGGPVAVLGAAISWSWSLLGLPNTLTTFWIVIILPLLAGAIWQGWIVTNGRVWPKWLIDQK